MDSSSWTNLSLRQEQFLALQLLSSRQGFTVSLVKPGNLGHCIMFVYGYEECVNCSVFFFEQILMSTPPGASAPSNSCDG